MRRIMFWVVCIACSILVATTATAQKFPGKKILYIDSYHEGYEWSDGITSAIRQTLKGTGVELKVFRMDTKRNASTEFKNRKAEEAKSLIESYKPDVVIASDDNASLFIVSRYYKDADLPIVFCGVNWDVTNYGYPYKNATGMVEMSGARQLVDMMKPMAKGPRIGYIAASEYTDQKEADIYKKVFHLEMKTYFTKDFAEWKEKFSALQNEVDMIIVGNNAGIKGWNDAEAQDYVLKNTKVPTGALYEWLTNYALIGATNVPEEQGEWSAQTALKILGGTPPSAIKISSNKKINIVANRKIEKSSGIKIPADIIGKAVRVIE
ncbi:MAG TPA: ABC transporter substrate binding protein [Deltaproteobacteria bacterium]|nr:ABC transporter substrate binding protein [Deltaproteobacteria bacterium]